nr:glycogen/starch/alpha-glucan phosphorylase [Proteus sp. G2671]
MQFEVDFGGRLQQEYFLVSASVQDILQRLTVSKIDSKRDVISSLLFY